MTYLSYKGYKGTIEPQVEAVRKTGYRYLTSTTLTELEAEFKASVTAILRIVLRWASSPDTPFKGSVNIRIGEELHRKDC